MINDVGQWNTKGYTKRNTKGSTTNGNLKGNAKGNKRRNHAAARQRSCIPTDRRKFGQRSTFGCVEGAARGISMPAYHVGAKKEQTGRE